MPVTSSQTIKKYDFASVGELKQKRDDDAPPISPTPIGIKTPLEFDYSSNSLVTMHKDLANNIRDNFRNMLQTNHGVRMMLQDFGANLEELAFEISTEPGDMEAIRRIRQTTKKYMPFIDLQTFEPMIRKKSEAIAQIGIRITYAVPAANILNQVVEVTIYIAG